MYYGSIGSQVIKAATEPPPPQPNLFVGRECEIFKCEVIFFLPTVESVF